MEWIESIREAISYIEENITEDLSVNEIAVMWLFFKWVH